MRGIKFRAWDGCRMKHSGLKVHADGHLECDSNLDCIDFEPVLMQYTGLKDKNGVEIYEGDIVTGWYHNLFVDYSKVGEVKFGYTYDSDGYANERILGWTSSNGSSLADLEECAVIGNIYENPELLESK